MASTCPRVATPTDCTRSGCWRALRGGATGTADGKRAECARGCGAADGDCAECELDSLLCARNRSECALACGGVDRNRDECAFGGASVRALGGFSVGRGRAARTRRGFRRVRKTGAHSTQSPAATPRAGTRARPTGRDAPNAAPSDRARRPPAWRFMRGQHAQIPSVQRFLQAAGPCASRTSCVTLPTGLDFPLNGFWWLRRGFRGNIPLVAFRPRVSRASAAFAPRGRERKARHGSGYC